MKIALSSEAKTSSITNGNTVTVMDGAARAQFDRAINRSRVLCSWIKKPLYFQSFQPVKLTLQLLD